MHDFGNVPRHVAGLSDASFMHVGGHIIQDTGNKLEAHTWKPTSFQFPHVQTGANRRQKIPSLIYRGVIKTIVKHMLHLSM